MGSVKAMFLEMVDEKLGTSDIFALDPDWQAHRFGHSPSPSCSYCVQDADVPEEVLEDEEVYE